MRLMLDGTEQRLVITRQPPKVKKERNRRNPTFDQLFMFTFHSLLVWNDYRQVFTPADHDVYRVNLLRHYLTLHFERDGVRNHKTLRENRILLEHLSNYNENYNSKREDLEEEDQGEDERNVIL